MPQRYPLLHESVQARAQARTESRTRQQNQNLRMYMTTTRHAHSVCMCLFALVISLVLQVAVGCTLQPATLPGVYPFVQSGPGANIILSSGTKLGTDESSESTLILTDETTAASTGVSAWSSMRVRVTGGFVAKFKYRMSPNALGFAFVVQDHSSVARGGASANLGYTFPKSFAVEFDIKQDAQGDPNSNHVELHTKYAADNSPARDAYIDNTIAANPPTLATNTWKSVEIQYSNVTSFLTVRIDNQLVLQSSIRLAHIPMDHAFIGFTSSTSETNRALVEIKQLEISTARISPSVTKSKLGAQIPNGVITSPRTASSTLVMNTPLFTFTLYDVCERPLTATTRELDYVTVTASAPGATTSVVASGTGSYSVYGDSPTAGTYTLTLEVNAAEQSSAAQLTFTVVPGVPVASTVTITPNPESTPFQAGVAQTFELEVRDAQGNIIPSVPGVDLFLARFACCSEIRAVSQAGNKHVFQLRSDVADDDTSLEIRLNGAPIPGSPFQVSVLPGSAIGSKSFLSGAGLGIVAAGTANSFELHLRDEFDNPVDQQTPDPGTYTLQLYDVANPGSPIHGNISWIAPSGASAGRLQFTYEINTAGTYGVTCTAGTPATPCKDASSVRIRVEPNGFDPAVATIVLAGTDTTALGSTPVGVPFLLDIVTRDNYGNRRNQPNPVDDVFNIQVSGSGQLATTLCHTSYATAPSSQVANIKDLRCGFHTSGVYRLSFYVTKADSYDIAMNINGGATLKTANFDATAGAPSGIQSTVTVQAAALPGVAGTAVVITYLVRDQFGNPITTDAKNVIVPSISSASNAPFRQVVLGTITQSGEDPSTYTQEITFFDAMTYTVRASIAGVNFPTSASIVIAPGPFNPANSVVTLTPTAAISGETVSIIVKGYDEYQNQLTSASADLVAKMTYGEGVETDLGDPAVDTPEPGSYTFTATVPDYTSPPSFTIRVSTQAGDTQVGSTVVGSILDDSSVSHSTATLQGSAVVAAFETVTYELVNRNSDGSEKNTTAFFSVTATHNSGSPVLSAAITQTSPGNATAAFNPRVAGEYTVRVFCDGVETEESKSVPDHLKYTVTPGAIEPALCLIQSTETQLEVGLETSFDVILRDAAQNLVDRNSTNAPFTVEFLKDMETEISIVTVSARAEAGKFTVTYTPQTAGVILVSVRSTESGNQVLGTSFTTLVRAGQPSAPQSSVSVPASPACHAGSLCTAIFVPRDANANFYTFIDQSPEELITVSLTSNPSLSSVAIVRDTEETEQYLVQFVPSIAVAGTAILTLSAPTFSFTLQSQAFTINPALVPSPSQSSVTGLQGSFDANTPISFLITVKDAFGNAWAYSDLSLYEVSVINSNNVFTVIPNSYKVYAGPGQVRVSWTIRTAGTYNWRIRVGSASSIVDFGISQSPPTIPGFVPVVIAPGVVNAANCVVSRPPETLVAGASANVVLTTRDRYGNVRTTPTPNAIITVTFYTGQFACVQGVPTETPTAALTNVVNANATSNGDGTYNIQLYSEVANPVNGVVRGRYFYVVRFNGELVGTCATSTDSIQVVPDVISYGHSKILGLDANGFQAHTSVKLQLHFADKWGNPVTTIPDPLPLLLVGEHVPGEFPNAADLNAEFDAHKEDCKDVGDPLQKNMTSGIDTTPGTYVELTFDAGAAARHLFILTLDGVVVGKPSCMSLLVTPGVLDTWTLATTPSSTPAYASKPLTIEIQSKDGAGNVLNLSELPASSPIAQFSYVATLELIEPDTEATGGPGSAALPLAYTLTTASYVDLDPSSPTFTGGHHQVRFAPRWPGKYEVSVIVNEATPTQRSIVQAGIQVDVLPALCPGRKDSTLGDRPYECQDGTCVRDYSECQELSGVEVDQCTYYCGNPPTCQTDLAQCWPDVSACPATTQLCISPSGHRYCAHPSASCPSASLLPESVFPDSPARVCAPMVVLCPDGVTCARSTNDCPYVASTNATDVWERGHMLACADSVPFACPDGTCRARYEDCPSTKLCKAATDVICPDGTCASSLANCMRLPPCPMETPVRCADGSCATAKAFCPTGVTCPLGHVVCPRGSLVCARSIEECESLGAGDNHAGHEDAPQSSDTSNGCPAHRSFRCPNGGPCVMDPSFCPTRVTCPTSAPVLCPDGNCVDSVAACTTAGSVAPVQCPENKSYLCPGTRMCVESPSHCPTDITCPAERPIRCANGVCIAPPTANEEDDEYLTTASVSCPLFARGVSSVGSLTHPSSGTSVVAAPSPSPFNRALPPCPSTRPVRCADGSCARSVARCPTLITCPANRPVKCEDGSCRASKEGCFIPELETENGTTTVSRMACPVGWIRCLAGGCAPAYTECPTTMSCQPNEIKCADGTCRTSCAAVVSNIANAAPVCPESKPVRCPEAQAGVVCAATLRDCPQSFICPASRPVRCPDATCAASIEDCPIVDTSTYPTTRVPCPGGGWAASQDLCPTSITCPESTPVKCWDESCRVVQADCPPMRECPLEKPFLCPDGSCQLSLWSCSSSRCTDPARPIRCPAYSTQRGCVAKLSDCMDVTNLSTPPQIECPFGQRCWDGSCSSELRLCPPRTCPKNSPYLCENGACAISPQACPLLNGCPFDMPHLCPNGQCAVSASACQPIDAFLQCTSERPVRCPDGSCRESASECTVTSFGCPTTAPNVCHDKTCAATPSDIGGDTIIACKDTSATHNACPASRPYRCPGGYCARSSTRCPVRPERTGRVCRHTPLGPMTAFCDDGSCAFSLDECPIIKPCGRNEFRCPDNTCKPLGYEISQAEKASFRDNPNSIFNTHPFHGAPCSGVNTCPSDRPYRCQDGLCVAHVSQCIDDYPKTLNRCCADGIAYNRPSQFSPLGNCALTSSNCVAPARDGNHNGGCPIDSTRCSTGICVPRSAQNPSAPSWLTCSHYEAPQVSSHETNIYGLAAANGCPAHRPIKCADGACVADASSCLLPNGCPASTPMLCASGSCVATEADCDGSDCPVSKPFRCSNGHCADSLDKCRHGNGCPLSHPYRCATGHCATRPATIADTMALSLITIQDFVLDPVEDEVLIEVCPPTVACDGLTPYRCADGTCAAKLDYCRPVQPCSDPCAVRCPGSLACVRATLDSSSNQAVCPMPSLAELNKLCKRVEIPGALEKCPASNPILCPDGSCRGSRSECPDPLAGPGARTCGGSTPVRCFDGSCAESYMKCVERRWNNYKEPSAPDFTPETVVDGESSNDICPSGQYVCPDGSCVKSLADCAPVPACPAQQYRCPDGSCATSCDSAANPPSCPTGSVLCEDGLCRRRCVPYQGCPLAIPFSCPLKATRCTKTAAECDVVVPTEAKQKTATTTVLETAQTEVEPSPMARTLLHFGHDDKPHAIKPPSDIVLAPDRHPKPKPSPLPKVYETTTPSNAPEWMRPMPQKSVSRFSTMDNNAVPGQEACAYNCERDVEAMSQSVLLDPTETTTLDVSINSDGVPRTRLTISSGSFASPVVVGLYPVPPVTLDATMLTAYSTQSAASIYVPFTSSTPLTFTGSLEEADKFATKVLSTPFHCDFNGTQAASVQPTRAMTVSAYIDTYEYSSSGGGDGGSGSTGDVPCELQATFDAAMNPADNQDAVCEGEVVFSANSMNITFQNCEGTTTEDIPALMTMQATFVSRSSVVAWNQLNSQECVCFKVTQAEGADAARAAASLPSLVDKTVCVFAERASDWVTLTFPNDFPLTASDAAMATCPNEATGSDGISRSLVSTIRPGSVDVCATSSGDLGSNIIPAEDICLAQYQPSTGKWSCVLDRDGRLANPVRSSALNPNRVSSPLPSCTAYAYAFAHILMPPAPDTSSSKSWWAEYGTIVIAVVSSVGGVILLGTLAVLKVSRDRAEYKEKQAKLASLHARAEEIQEYEGGLGIADKDQEIVMTANPLVLDIERAQKELDATMRELAGTGQEQQREIVRLEAKRRMLHAKLEEMRKNLAEQHAKLSSGGGAPGFGPKREDADIPNLPSLQAAPGTPVSTGPISTRNSVVPLLPSSSRSSLLSPASESRSSTVHAVPPLTPNAIGGQSPSVTPAPVSGPGPAPAPLTPTQSRASLRPVPPANPVPAPAPAPAPTAAAAAPAPAPASASPASTPRPLANSGSTRNLAAPLPFQKKRTNI